MPKTSKSKTVKKDTPVSVCVHKSKRCRPTKLCTKCMTSLISNLSRSQRNNSQEQRAWMSDMQRKYDEVNTIVIEMELAIHQLEEAWAAMEDTEVDSDNEVEIIDLRQPKYASAYWPGGYTHHHRKDEN